MGGKDPGWRRGCSRFCTSACGLVLTSCVTLGKSLTLTNINWPHLQKSLKTTVETTNLQKRKHAVELSAVVTHGRVFMSC